MEHRLRLIDEAWARLLDLEETLASAVGGDTAGLCRCRIAVLLQNEVELEEAAVALAGPKVAALASWPTSPLFTTSERAHLALAEQLVIDAQGVDDPLVDALAAHRSPSEIYTFARFVQVTEARQRAQLVLRRHSDRGRFG